jgi:hypothetical protein
MSIKFTLFSRGEYKKGRKNKLIPDGKDGLEGSVGLDKVALPIKIEPPYGAR